MSTFNPLKFSGELCLDKATMIYLVVGIMMIVFGESLVGDSSKTVSLWAGRVLMITGFGIIGAILATTTGVGLYEKVAIFVSLVGIVYSKIMKRRKGRELKDLGNAGTWLNMKNIIYLISMGVFGYLLFRILKKSGNVGTSGYSTGIMGKINENMWLILLGGGFLLNVVNEFGLGIELLNIISWVMLLWNMM